MRTLLVLSILLVASPAGAFWSSFWSTGASFSIPNASTADDIFPLDFSMTATFPGGLVFSPTISGITNQPTPINFVATAANATDYGITNWSALADQVRNHTSLGTSVSATIDTPLGEFSKTCCGQFQTANWNGWPHRTLQRATLQVTGAYPIDGAFYVSIGVHLQGTTFEVPEPSLAALLLPLLGLGWRHR